MPMEARFQFRLLLAVAIGLTVAPSLAAQSRRTTPAPPSDDAIGKPGALTASETAVLNSMKDESIIAHLMLEDSTTAALAGWVAGIAHDTAVGSFAKELATDHAHALDRDRSIIPELRDLPRQAPGDSTDRRALRSMDTRLRGLGPDSSLDQTFVSAQLIHHVHVLNELGALRATAKLAPVQQRLDDAMAIERAHLTRAKRLAQAMGLPRP
jgi:hypothetical protein